MSVFLEFSAYLAVFQRTLHYKIVLYSSVGVPCLFVVTTSFPRRQGKRQWNYWNLFSRVYRKQQATVY